MPDKASGKKDNRTGLVNKAAKEKEAKPEKDGQDKDKDKGKQKPHSETWERVMLARHIERPHALDFIRALTDEFVEMHGDRRFGEDAALVGGVASFQGRTVMVLGHQKGRNTKDNITRNWGMPHPEGYRKALRLMEHAAKFRMPILSFIDTAGAYPGKEGEERGMSQAIAENLLAMCRLPVPIIATVTGEGGSGGALAIGIGDRILMLENSIYSVASPEASATILWKDAAQAPAAAEAMKITAPDLYKFGIIDDIIPEPPGGAHTDRTAMMNTLREALAHYLGELEQEYVGRGEEGIRALLDARYQKYRKIGEWSELSSFSDN